MVTNSFGNRNFMQPRLSMHPLKVPLNLFLFKFRVGWKDFLLFSFLHLFPSCFFRFSRAKERGTLSNQGAYFIPLFQVYLPYYLAKIKVWGPPPGPAFLTLTLLRQGLD
jgi:hypothetical protein